MRPHTFCLAFALTTGLVLTSLASPSARSLLRTASANPPQFPYGAQNQLPADIAAASPECLSTFTVGPNDVACITNHGNVGMWKSYGGQSHFQDEGYVICDLTTGVRYMDVGSFEDGWQTASISQPNGPNTFPLAIQRQTSPDGWWLLTQKFVRNATTSELTITMILKNTTASYARSVRILRRADLMMNGQFGNYVDRTVDSVWVRANSGIGAIGLRATPLTRTFSTHIEPSGGTWGGDCSPVNAAVPGYGDYVRALINYDPVTVAGGKAITRTVVYSRR
jgi:hypothetical protein